MTAENISMAAHISDVRVRGLRAHDARARDPLPAPEGEPPLQPRPPQVLRQATLQVQQQQLCEYAAPVQLIKTDIYTDKTYYRHRYNLRYKTRQI